MKIENDFLKSFFIVKKEEEHLNVITLERKKELHSFILVLLANIVFGFLNFHSKLTKQIFDEEFNPVSFMIYRSFSICLIGYILCRYNKERIIKFEEIERKFWFLVRTVGTYFSFFTFIMCIMYFRASTASCINSCFPAVAIFFSIIFLNEEFHIRYFIGLLICFLGTLLIIFNERSDPGHISTHLEEFEEINNENSMRLVYGSIFGILNIFIVGMLNVSVKIVTNEKINLNEQCYWVGLTNLVCGLLHLFFMGSLSLNLGYFVFSLLNGLFFYWGNYLLVEGYRNIQISKTAPLAYTTTITVFILGVLLLGEPIFFTDILGSLMILSFNLYNTYVPLS